MTLSDPVAPASQTPPRNPFRRHPILSRLLLGNFLVVITGAVIGTIVTRRATSLSVTELILLFSGIGIIFSLGMNYWVINTALIPLRELRLAVDNVKASDKSIKETNFMQADPDIRRLLMAINSMLERLDYRTSLLSALSERAINAQEEERKRIARTLHDDTAQSISTLIIQLERIETSFDKALFSKKDQQLALSNARQLATNILEELRKNIWDLRPSILDDLGLCPAIRWFARSSLEDARIGVEFLLPPENIRLPAHIETMLYRITQEAVNNIVHHSDAHQVIIRLIPEKSRICLEIEDDGRGFDTSTIGEQAVSRKRLGLLGIKERASLVSGNFVIESHPGTGTRIHVCVPFDEEIVFNDQHEIASATRGPDNNLSLEEPLKSNP